MRLLITIAAAILAAAGISEAASPAAQRVNLTGTIVSARGTQLVVQTATGRTTLAYGSKTRLFGVDRSSLDKVGTGSFIGTTVAAQPDGTFKSTEVHIFAENLRGTGEGFTKMDDSAHHLMANSTVRSVAVPHMMANSTVRSSMVGTSGKTITMVFPSGTKTIHIPTGIPIVYIERATPAMLVAGAHVQVAGLSSNNRITARFIIVGEHGMVPPN